MQAIRPGRFFDTNPSNWSLVKIGEYQRTPLYEPSLRAMCMSLTDVRRLLKKELSENASFKQAWQTAEKLYERKLLAHPKRMEGIREYYIAIICFTLEEPNLYESFNQKCENLTFQVLDRFPYASLLFLLVQAELRMKTSNEIDHYAREKSIKTYSRVYRALHRGIKIDHLKERDLIAMNKITPTTLDKEIAMINIRENGGTLIEIQQLGWSAKNIEIYSAFPVEQEVLVWPWSKFYIEKIEAITTNITKIIVKPTSRSFLEDMVHTQTKIHVIYENST